PQGHVIGWRIQRFVDTRITREYRAERHVTLFDRSGEVTRCRHSTVLLTNIHSPPGLRIRGFGARGCSFPCRVPRTPSRPLAPATPATGVFRSTRTAAGAASGEIAIGTIQWADVQLDVVHHARTGSLEPVLERARVLAGHPY